MDGTLVAGSTYYHGRLLHHHPRKAADSTMLQVNPANQYFSFVIGDLLRGYTHIR